MRKKIVRELANQFDLELEEQLQIYKLPDDSIVYRNFLVKQLQSGKWGVFNIEHQYMANSYHLKCCAAMAAKSYHHRNLNRCDVIKELDRNYWVCYGDTIVFKNNLAKATDERYQILQTRLNESSINVNFHKKQITQLFKTIFC